MPGSSPQTRLREQLGRWVADGLIDSGQAARIEAVEAARAQAAARAPSGRIPLTAEALGYAGGVLAVAAGVLVVGLLWPGIPTWAELALAAAAAAALGAGGAAVRPGRDPALARLRSVLWLLSVLALAAFAAVLAAQAWDFSPASTALVTGAAATGYAVALWLRGRTALQHVTMFAAAALLTGAAIARAGPGLGDWPPGLGVWLLSALWAAAAGRGYLAPRTAGYLAAAVGLLIGAQLTMQLAAGQALAFATVAGLLAAGVMLRRTWLVAVGAVGVLQVVPQAASRYLPATLSAPLSVFASGLALLGLAVWLAKRRAARPR